jgi:hypothetical protein
LLSRRLFIQRFYGSRRRSDYLFPLPGVGRSWRRLLSGLDSASSLCTFRSVPASAWLRVALVFTLGVSLNSPDMANV